MRSIGRDNRGGVRRVHVDNLKAGELRLSPAASHHLRDVLRIDAGEAVELFDNDGNVARATVRDGSADGVVVEVVAVERQTAVRAITVASAVPKGDRADWMVEKLSELGVSAFVPLRTERSVVHPEGAGKLDRWRRIAIEAAKQSRRPGVMRIDPLISLTALLSTVSPAEAIFLSTGDAAVVGTSMAARAKTLFIGPEGGWTPAEEAAMLARGLTPASLGPTILRIETAAVLSAGLITVLSQETGLSL